MKIHYIKSFQNHFPDGGASVLAEFRQGELSRNATAASVRGAGQSGSRGDAATKATRPELRPDGKSVGDARQQRERGETEKQVTVQLDAALVRQQHQHHLRRRKCLLDSELLDE